MRAQFVHRQEIRVRAASAFVATQRAPRRPRTTAFEATDGIANLLVHIEEASS
jgi:hypothetical protein